MFGKKKSPDKGKSPDNEEWKEIKDLVDSIFTKTKEPRDKMLANYDLFGGRLWKNNEIKDTDSRAQINTVFSTIASVAPMVTDNNPITYLIPHLPFLERLGNSYNNALKYAWNVCDMQMNMYKGVIDAMLCSYAVFKVGFDATKTFGGDVAVDLIDPADFFLAPGYDEIWRAPYCGVRTVKPLSWIRANFPDAEGVKATKSESDESNVGRYFKFGETSRIAMEGNFATVYEVWMKDDSVIPEEIQDKDDPAKKMTVDKKKYQNGAKWVFFTSDVFLGEIPCDEDDGLPPYVELKDYILPHDFMGISEVDQIEGLHKELNLTLQALVKHNRKYADPNEMIDISGGFDVENYKNKKDLGGQTFTYDSSGGVYNNPVERIAQEEIPETAPLLVQLLVKYIQDVSGVTDVTKGMVGKQERQSAVEISILKDSSSTRVRQRVRNLEWTIKRVSYLLVRRMQQYYNEPREVFWRQDQTVNYMTLGNSKAQADQIMRPSPGQDVEDAMNRQETGLPMSPEMQQIIDQHAQEQADYEKFINYFKESGEHDPIFFEFDIDVDTNSTLPMDKQTLANLVLNLFKLKGVDRQALLEILQIPRWQEINSRMDQKEQMILKAKMGQQQQPQPPAGPSPMLGAARSAMNG